MTLRFSLFSGLAPALVTFAGSTLCVNAQDIPQRSSDPVAIIGFSVISDEEVERIAAGRPLAYVNLPADERRARITDMLVAEYLIDYYYGRDTQQLSPQVFDALNDARRQVPIASKLFCQCDDVLGQTFLVRQTARCLALRRAMLPQCAANPALGYAESLSHMVDTSTAAGRA